MSFHPLSQLYSSCLKRSLVSCLIHRIFNLCSNDENFHAQLEVVRKLCNMNGFTSHMFDQIVRRFLNNIFKPKSNVYAVLKKMVISAFLSLADTLFKFEPKYLDFVTLLISIFIRFVFRSSTRVSYFFPFKHKVPKFLKSGVVYLFKCRCCSTSYVGQTTRHLHTRV